MHSNIYQISKDPIKKDDFIDESRYYDGFVGSIADYVHPLTDKERIPAFEMLKSCLGGSAKFEGEKFTIVDKEAYFRSKYEAWKNCLQRLGDCSFEQFISPPYEGRGLDSMGMLHYQCEELYNDKYSIYMDDNGEYYGNRTLDEFMREAQNNETYYLGAVTDYHM